MATTSATVDTRDGGRRKVLDGAVRPVWCLISGYQDSLVEWSLRKPTLMITASWYGYNLC